MIFVLPFCSLIIHFVFFCFSFKQDCAVEVGINSCSDDNTVRGS